MNNKIELKKIIEEMYCAKENPSEEKLLALQQEITSFEDDSEFTEHIIKFDIVIAKFYLQLTEIEFEKNNFQEANIIFNNVINFVSQIKFLLNRTHVSDKIKMIVMDWTNKVDKWKKNSDYFYSLNIGIEEKIEGIKNRLRSIRTSSDVQKVNLMIQETENLCEELLRFTILEHVNKFGGYLGNDISFIDRDIRNIIEMHLDERIRNYENKLLFEMGENEYLRAKMDKLIEYPIEKDIKENKEIYKENHISIRVNLIYENFKKYKVKNLLVFIDFLKERVALILELKKSLFVAKINILKDDLKKIPNDDEKYKISIEHVQKEFLEFEIISYIENIDLNKEISQFKSRNL